MTLPSSASASWPSMPWQDWSATIDTLHMWTQVIGKIRMAQVPPLNHWWHVPLYVSARGLTTSAMPYGDRLFQIDLDLVDHRLTAEESGGRVFAMDLRPMSVAAFYRALMAGLETLGVNVSIRTRPVEVVVAIPFEEDEQHATYERDHAHALWLGLSAAHRVLTEFRGGFRGKASPVHFFWGGFDLAVTRFSGRPAPVHPGGAPNCPDWVQEEAYSHEVSSAGWWPSSPDLGPVFYSYMYPEPDGFARAAVQPERGTYSPVFREFLLPNDDLKGAADPESAISAFLESTYDAGATLAGWDRVALEVNDRRSSSDGAIDVR